MNRVPTMLLLLALGLSLPLAAGAAQPPPAVATQQAAVSDAPSAPDATTAPAAADARGVDEEIQALKKDVVDLNRDLFSLEEELLFPANTQVAVFLSMDVGEFFALDTVQLRIDNKEVTKYLYTPREAEALLEAEAASVFLLEADGSLWAPVATGPTKLVCRARKGQCAPHTSRMA